MTTLLIILTILFILQFLASTPSLRNIKAEWEEHLPEATFSPQELYALIESYVTEKNMKSVSITRITLSQGSVFSGRREYLRIERKGQAFDICAFLYGNGIYISWRFGQVVDVLPKQTTFYQLDTSKAFRKIVQRAVASSINSLSNQQLLREVQIQDDEFASGNTET